MSCYCCWLFWHGEKKLVYPRVCVADEEINFFIFLFSLQTSSSPLVFFLSLSILYLPRSVNGGECGNVRIVSPMYFLNFQKLRSPCQLYFASRNEHSDVRSSSPLTLQLTNNPHLFFLFLSFLITSLLHLSTFSNHSLQSHIQVNQSAHTRHTLSSYTH